MSAIIKGLQIFSGLGAVATTPLAVQFANKHINQLPSKGGRLVSGEPEERPVPQQERKLSSRDAMEKAKEIMGKEGGGEKKCFGWPRVRGLELFGCVYMNKLEEVFLFHGDVNGRLGLKEKINQIISLARGAQMKFEENQGAPSTHLVKMAFAGLHKGEGEFIPKKHCSIAENVGVKKNYQLTCKSPSERNGDQLFVNESIDL